MVTSDSNGVYKRLVIRYTKSRIQYLSQFSTASTPTFTSKYESHSDR